MATQAEHLLVGELIGNLLAQTASSFARYRSGYGLLKRPSYLEPLGTSGFISKRSDTDAGNTAQDEFTLLAITDCGDVRVPGVSLARG